MGIFVAQIQGGCALEPTQFPSVFLMPLPMKVTPFGRSPQFQDRFPQKIRLPPSSGDVHVGIKRGTTRYGTRLPTSDMA